MENSCRTSFSSFFIDFLSRLESVSYVRKCPLTACEIGICALFLCSENRAESFSRPLVGRFRSHAEITLFCLFLSCFRNLNL